MKRFASLLLMALSLAGVSMTGASAQAPYNGTPTGTPVYIAAPTGFGQQLANSAGNYITLPGDPMGFAAGTSWTVEGRLATSAAATGTYQWAVGRVGNGSGNLGVGINGSGTIAAAVGFTSGLVFLGTSSPVVIGSVHSYALVCVAGANAAANSTVTLYVDGAAAGTASGVWNPGTGAGVDQIGAFNNTGGLVGSIDEIALSTTAQYTAGYTPAAAPFANSRAGQVALYHLDGNALDSNGGASGAATAYTAALSASSGPVGSPVTVSLAANGTDSTHTVTATVSGVSVSAQPAPVTLAGTSAVTVSFTPTSVGTATVTLTNSGGLTNPAALTYTVTAAPVVLGVTSPALGFSPATWTGDNGRVGTVYRQTPYPGAYMVCAFTSSTSSPAATLLLDTSLYGGEAAPQITYTVDGAAFGPVSASGNIAVSGLSGVGAHLLTVYLSSTAYANRWGTTSTSPADALRVTGVQLDGGSSAGTAGLNAPWALLVGDSITEGWGAGASGTNDAFYGYASLVGAALRRLGYEYGVSALAGTGYIAPGNGGAPALYSVASGTYSDVASRWNKLDAAHSLLDSNGHLSAYGGTGQEPAVIIINMMTNEELQGRSLSDAQASATALLTVYRGSDPSKPILALVPPGLYSTAVYGAGAGGPAYVAALKAGVAAYQAAHPADTKTVLIDLGPSTSALVESAAFGTQIHFPGAAHARVAPPVLAAIQAALAPASTIASTYQGQIRRGR